MRLRGTCLSFCVQQPRHCTRPPLPLPHRLTVKVAERLVQLEARGVMLPLGPTCVAVAAGAGASCAMLAARCPLSAADLARVAAAAAVTLGSGRQLMQAAAQLSDAVLVQLGDSLSDVLDSMHYCILLATQRGVMKAFARDVAPPALLLGWLQPAAAILTRLGNLGSTDRAGEG